MKRDIVETTTSGNNGYRTFVPGQRTDFVPQENTTACGFDITDLVPPHVTDIPDGCTSYRVYVPYDDVVIIFLNFRDRTEERLAVFTDDTRSTVRPGGLRSVTHDVRVDNGGTGHAAALAGVVAAAGSLKHPKSHVGRRKIVRILSLGLLR